MAVGCTLSRLLTVLLLELDMTNTWPSSARIIQTGGHSLTSAPRFAGSNAISALIPQVPPVITAVLPAEGRAACAGMLLAPQGTV